MWIDDKYYSETEIINLVHTLQNDKLFYRSLYLDCLKSMQRNFEIMSNHKEAETTAKLIKKVEELE